MDIRKRVGEESSFPSPGIEVFVKDVWLERMAEVDNIECSSTPPVFESYDIGFGWASLSVIFAANTREYHAEQIRKEDGYTLVFGSENSRQLYEAARARYGILKDPV